MNRLLYKMPCQSVSRCFKNKEIYETLFDKRVDKRYLESAVQRFIILNKRMFDFLGIEVELSGTDNDLNLVFRSSDYIGAIPIKMPYDGITHKDFQIIPRFDNDKDVYSELTQLLTSLNYSIKPERSEFDLLCEPMKLQPPIYYEAFKYIELYNKAYKYSWLKFDAKEQNHPYPKSSTNWSKHASKSYNPANALVFPSKDSILSTNHTEWRELKYVFNLSKEEILSSTVPSSIRFKYEKRIRYLSNKVDNIEPIITDKMVVRAADPQCIKELKEQANVILQKSSNNSSAWRMSMSLLFERYVQMIVEKSTRELSGTVISNSKIVGRGNIPSWGLKYLEPDIEVKIGNCIYMGDAKYKANFYASESQPSILKETHRADLHQILAYCSFEPQNRKIGILFYPSKYTHYRSISYTDRVGSVSNRVILCGIAFGVDEMKSSIDNIKSMLTESVVENNNIIA